MSIELTNNCTGCFACESVCSKGAICLSTNDKGFYIPEIDSDKCIECGECKRVCPEDNKLTPNMPLIVVAAIAKDRSIQETCSSGGAFGIFAKNVFSLRGAVGGCTFSNELVAEQNITEAENEIYRYYGSKYVQSLAFGFIKKVRNIANNGKRVMVCGTPCQIAGSKKALGDKDNIIYVDIICHGVTSPKLFKYYINDLRANHNKIIEINFRSKEITPWGVFCAKIVDEIKVNYQKGSVNPYYATFLGMKAYSDVCYKCQYSQKKRISDLTIGDAWGCHDYCSTEFVSKGIKGISEILINTEKGQKFFEQVKQDFYFEEVSYEKVATFQKNLNAPSSNGGVEFYDKNILDVKYYLSKMKSEIKTVDRIKNIIPITLSEKIKVLLRGENNGR